MKLVVREKVNAIAEPTIKEYKVLVSPVKEYSAIHEDIGLAKGDLIVFRGNGDPVRLPVGVSGKVLTADPTQTVGLRWGDAGGSSGATTLLKNASGATITQGTILALLPADQTLNPREAAKAQRFSGEQLYIVKEDASSGADVECYHIPGTICQVLVTGTCDYLDPLVVSSTAGIAEALPTGTPTVGYALEAKASSATGLINALIVENKTIGIANAVSTSYSNGTLYRYSGGQDTDGFGLGYPYVKTAWWGEIPCGVQANTQITANGLGLMHYKHGENVFVDADKNRVDVGDWMVPSRSDSGKIRSGIGYGIGHSLESKAEGSAGKVKVALNPGMYGRGFKNYRWYQGETVSEAWSGTLTWQTENNVSYTMTKMAASGEVMYGAITGTGTEEKCLYGRTGSIDLTDYNKLIVRFGYTSASLSSGQTKIYYGISNPAVTTAKGSTITSLFTTVYDDTITTAATKATYDYAEYALDVSSLTGSYDFLVVAPRNNISGTLRIAIEYLYFM